MANTLNACEAYLAGAHDVKIVIDQLDYALKTGNVTGAEAGQFAVDALHHLLQGRIERGEIVPEDTLPQGHAA